MSIQQIHTWIHPRRILLSTDLTDLKFILPLAVQQCLAYKAELKIVHVLPNQKISVIDPVLLIYSPFDQIQKSAETALSKAVESAKDAGIRCSSQLVAGDTVMEIIEIARAWKADRLVAGSHGREKFHVHLLGSVAESLFHHIDIPVLAVGPKTESKRDVSKNRMRILFATALDHDSQRMAEFAFGVAEQHHAEIIFLHVAPELTQGHPSAARVVTYAENMLDELLRAQTTKNCRPSREVAYGQPAEMILKHARQYAADMIILGASGHSAFNARFIPGTAYRVLSESPCPVLVLKQESAWVTVPSGSVRNEGIHAI